MPSTTRCVTFPPSVCVCIYAGGNYEGPHTHASALAKIIGSVLRAKPQAILFENANPRHAHEWRIWAEADIPENKVLIPGVLDTTSNFVEDPELVAERIERFAGIVGRERVLAGSDCGFGTFAGFGAIDPSICWAKLRAMSAGAELAGRRLCIVVCPLFSDPFSIHAGTVQI